MMDSAVVLVVEDMEVEMGEEVAGSRRVGSLILRLGRRVGCWMGLRYLLPLVFAMGVDVRVEVGGGWTG